MVGRRTALLLSTRHVQPLTYRRPGISTRAQSPPLLLLLLAKLH